MRFSLTFCALAIAVSPLAAGVASDSLVQMTAGATHLSIVGRLKKGKRSVVYQSRSPEKIAQLVACFDLVDVDGGDVEPDTFRASLCPCIFDYEIDITLANESHLTIELKHDFSVVVPNPSVLPKYSGNLDQTPEGISRTREWIEGRERRTRRYRQPR